MKRGSFGLLKLKGGDMEHRIKIQKCYLMHILEGKKTFEIRRNDRDYQVGDTIRFLPLEDEDYDVYKHTPNIPSYKIIYLLSCNGLQQGHVGLGITPE